MKSFIFLLIPVFLVIFAAVCDAGVMDAIKAVATAPSLIIGVVTVVLLYVFKAIPNDKIHLVVGKIARGLGTTISLGMNKLKYTQPFWEAIVEPYFIDLLDNTIATFAKELIAGMRSDNPK